MAFCRFWSCFLGSAMDCIAIANRYGDSGDPWGTPAVMSNVRDVFPLNLNFAFLSAHHDCIHLLYSFGIFSITLLGSILSNPPSISAWIIVYSIPSFFISFIHLSTT